MGASPLGRAHEGLALVLQAASLFAKGSGFLLLELEKRAIFDPLVNLHKTT